MKFPWKVLLHFRIEPFIWLLLVALCVRGVTFNQMIQDKICKNIHNKSDSFCRDLVKLDDNDPEVDVKRDVIIKFSKFNMYYQFFAFIPSLFAILVLGSWCDKYKPGRKILLIYSTLGIATETALQAYVSFNFSLDYRYGLLAAIPAALGASSSIGTISVYSYIPVTTPPDLISIRYMIVEALFWLGSPFATIIGGYLLNYNIYRPIGENGQLLNYQLVYISSAIFSMVSLIWIFLLINEDKDKKMLYKLCHAIDGIDDPMQRSRNIKSKIRPLDSIEEESKKKNPILMLFDFGILRDILHTIKKRRENRKRLQLWLILMTFVFVGLSYMAPLTIMYQFTQLAYGWNSENFSLFNSISMILNSMGILLGTLIFTKALKFNELTMAIFGITGFFISNIVRATLINSYGFWTATVLASLGGTATVGVRSYLCKIVDHDEIGKAFSLIFCIDGSLPFIGNFLFTMIFTQTLNNFIGAVFDVSGALLFIPLLTVMYIDLFCNKTADNIDFNNKNNIKPQNYNSCREEQITYRTKRFRSKRQVSTEL